MLDGCGGEGCDVVPDCSWLVLLPTAFSVLLGACRADAVDPYTHPRTRFSAVGARLVRSYQINVSARRARPVCNLSPSCSRYGLQMLAEHGVIRAGLQTRRRIKQCGRVGRARRLAAAPADHGPAAE